MFDRDRYKMKDALYKKDCKVGSIPDTTRKTPTYDGLTKIAIKPGWLNRLLQRVEKLDILNEESGKSAQNWHKLSFAS